jgi:hypothetical protein
MGRSHQRGHGKLQEVVDYCYYDFEDQLEEVAQHNGKVFTYGYGWRTTASGGPSASTLWSSPP